jgi:hypothetical protein
MNVRRLAIKDELLAMKLLGRSVALPGLAIPGPGGPRPKEC